jgi:DNA-binding NtrC family response regulator
MTGQDRLQRVFVVDDEPAIATTLALILRSKGFDAHSFTLPLEALEAARTEPPDLLLSDMLMPGLNGIDLATGVLRESPGCKVLLITGHTGTVDMLAASRARGIHFEVLSKPLHPTELLSKIEAMMNGTPSQIS